MQLTPAIQQALQRRQQGEATPQLNQTLPQAPQEGAGQTIAQSANSGTPQAIPQGMQSSPSPQPSDRRDTIVNALTKHLTNQDNLEKLKLERGF